MIPVDGRVTPHGAYLYERTYKPGSPVHAGLDLGASQGAEVRAPADGEVVVVDMVGKKGSGWHGYAPVVVIETRDGFFHLLAHLGAVKVSLGEKVAAGELVGTVGPERHCHWEVRYKLRAGVPSWKRTIDPMGWERGEVRPAVV